MKYNKNPQQKSDTISNFCVLLLGNFLFKSLIFQKLLATFPQKLYI